MQISSTTEHVTKRITPSLMIHMLRDLSRSTPRLAIMIASTPRIHPSAACRASSCISAPSLRLSAWLVRYWLFTLFLSSSTFLSQYSICSEFWGSPSSHSRTWCSAADTSFSRMNFSSSGSALKYQIE